MMLARHAECVFWMGRYIERALSLSGILLTQTAFNIGRAEGSGWSWVLALYDEIGAYRERHGEPTPDGVVAYYLTDREHLGSVASSIAAARANARSLRARVSTEFWVLINQTYKRVQELSEPVSEKRLVAVCERIRTDCYALMGSAEATFFRDEGWRFFRLGLEMERADQMSRLLDVRFAQLQTGDADSGETLGDFAFWAILLRSCGGYHAYRRLVSGPMEPGAVARFLIFEKGFARSLGHSVSAIERLSSELESECRTPTPEDVETRLTALTRVISGARADPEILLGLHGFNDRLQRRLADLTEAFTTTYFGGAPAEELEIVTDKPPARAADQEQMQTQSPIPGAAAARLA